MIEHFSHGFLTLAGAVAISMTGSALGLLLTRRARKIEEPRERVPWLITAAVAIGGTGIWVMHFVAMLGFAVTDATVRYHPGLTALSAAIAVVVVGGGLLVIGMGRYNIGRLLVAGTFTGIGVAAMHYTGMAAVTTSVALRNETMYVAAAVAIAIIASTVALWLAARLEKTASMWLAAAVMALAVNAMHYTAMMGVRTGAETGERASGVSEYHLLFPMSALTVIVILVLIYVVVTEPPLTVEPEHRSLV